MVSIPAEIEKLQQLNAAALRDKYREVFGEEARSYNKQFLFRRVAWRLQVLAEGGLSQRARRRAAEIANDVDLRIRSPKDFFSPHWSGAQSSSQNRDRRLPPPGTVLTREFKGRAAAVKVLEEGFEFEGRSYHSLSAIACEVTGTRWNGFLFFGLKKKPGRSWRTS